MPIRGVIFDLDETLVSSDLDYDGMRADLGLGPDQLILETVTDMPPGPQQDAGFAVIDRHEREGALRSTMIPGAMEFLDQLTAAHIRTGVLTRNSRAATDTVFANLGLSLSPALTREDAAPKPDPEGLLRICDEWQLPVTDVLFFGDFVFDLLAAANAGMRSVLYCPGRRPDFAEQADFVLTDYANAISIIEAASAG
ncbi:HAD family hydrolase [bacterium]|nr:HAD family hydrolase [bacterium]